MASIMVRRMLTWRKHPGLARRAACDHAACEQRHKKRCSHLLGAQ